MGQRLPAFGLRRGDRIPFFLDDTPAYPAAFFGAVRAGLVPVLLNTQTNAETLAYFLADTEARLVLCEADLRGAFSDDIVAASGWRRSFIVNGGAERTGPDQAEDFFRACRPISTARHKPVTWHSGCILRERREAEGHRPSSS